MINKAMLCMTVMFKLKFLWISLPCIFLTFPIFYSFLSFFVSRGDKDRLAEFWVAGGHRPVSLCDRLHVYTCGRSFVITYATSAWMSQFFLQSSFALHMCAVLNYLHPFSYWITLYCDCFVYKIIKILQKR